MTSPDAQLQQLGSNFLQAPQFVEHTSAAGARRAHLSGTGTPREAAQKAILFPEDLTSSHAFHPR